MARLSPAGRGVSALALRPRTNFVKLIAERWHRSAADILMVGTLLLHEIEAPAHILGYHTIVLSAFPFNQAGMRLYERFGFRTVGIYHEQGMIDGRWIDTIIMEKLLATR